MYVYYVYTKLSNEKLYKNVKANPGWPEPPVPRPSPSPAQPENILFFAQILILRSHFGSRCNDRGTLCCLLNQG